MPPPRPVHLAGLVLLLSLLAGAWSLHAGWIAVPDRYNPWAALDPAEAPGLLTRMKLARAQQAPARCIALLGEAGLRFERMPDRATGEGCGLSNAVRVSGARDLQLRPPVLLSCRVALSFALWERHALEPAAEELLGTRITAIDNLGGYACRNVVTGRPPQEGAPGRRSQHATADALDVAVFVRADGPRAVQVRRDWVRNTIPASTPEAAFLREVHRGACGLFDGVLGPDYNAVHADHFHLEIGEWRACR